MENTVHASPSKAFFVEMLTRDIDLKDAILDLLDNCVDGILRQLKTRGQSNLVKTEKPYTGYSAKITAKPAEFSIEDNCGGIPRDIAVNQAFRLGRSKDDLNRDSNVGTIGMYGIGMKRAIFKMGKNSTVISKHGNAAYSVKIPESWLNDDHDWQLNLVDLTSYSCQLEADGTSINVKSLHPQIADQFDKNRQPFLTDLAKEIGNLFALIIKKGFKVWLNDELIEPASLELLTPKDWNLKPAIQPYAYKASFDDVEINLVVGFYRELASASELDLDRQIPRSSENAGWTIICNERVVLHHDKTTMTGWGLRNIPKYHTQFIAIGGVVQFLSKNTFELPLNTTKRGLDTSTTIYWHTLDRMMEGIKKFTDFTNHWKGRESETKPYFEAMALTDAIEVPETIPQSSWNKVRKSRGERFSPTLPKPAPDERTRRISFVRLKDEVETVGEHLFGDRQAAPAEIGNRCFQVALDEAKVD